MTDSLRCRRLVHCHLSRSPGRSGRAGILVPTSFRWASSSRSQMGDRRLTASQPSVGGAGAQVLFDRGVQEGRDAVIRDRCSLLDVVPGEAVVGVVDLAVQLEHHHYEVVIHLRWPRYKGDDFRLFGRLLDLSVDGSADCTHSHRQLRILLRDRV